MQQALILLILLLSIFFNGSVRAGDYIIGDLNGSGKIDLYDLEILAGQWLDPPGCVGHPDDCADMVGDGDGVNMEDFGVLAWNWLKQNNHLVPYKYSSIVKSLLISKLIFRS